MFRSLQASTSTAARQLHTSSVAQEGWFNFLRRTPKSTSTSSTDDAGPSTPAAVEPPSMTLFDEVAEEVAQKREIDTEHRYSSAHHKISHRKLNAISRQIAGLPIDEAIVQMQFSEKRASKWIKSTLCLARDHAVNKGLTRDKLIVADTWINKGTSVKRLDIKGRGRAGIKHHPTSKIHIVLREGKTQMEKQEAKFRRHLDLVRSAGQVREDGKLRRKVISGWAW